MESDIIRMILVLLPEHLKEKGFKLIEDSKRNEEKRLLERSHRFVRARHYYRGGDEDEAQTKMKNKVKAVAIPLAIGRLVMELWSPKMRRHAENLILEKAVEEGFLEGQHLKWVRVLDDQEEGAEVDKEDQEGRAEVDNKWLIDSQDQTIIKLLWDVFDIKTHYEQVKSHRSYVLKSYFRLQKFLPTLQQEIIERHDLSKYAFSEAIGYTLKWVHGTYHAIWKNACDLHLFNEPHHPQVWSKVHTPENKKIKLLRWLSGTSDFNTDCLYGLDIVDLDLSTEDFPEPFLLESYVDMVGVEWERKKGASDDISTRKLAYIDDKFLSRYTKKQHEVIRKLIEQITVSDESWRDVPLTEREKILLNTVPSQRRGVFVCQVEIHTKNEENRLIKSASGGSNVASGPEVAQMNESDRKKVQDQTFFIMVGRATTELWDISFKNYVEQLILKKAVEEKQIKSSDIDWILVFESKDIQTESPSSRDASLPAVADEVIVKLLWDDFQLNEHFRQVQEHRYWVKRSYNRLADFMGELNEEVIDRHDLTKLTLSQSLGYTLKWMHKLNIPVWRKACDMHLNWEPHHPQMWSNKNALEHKKNCLEKWLGSRDAYGVIESTLDLGSENMARVFLLESLLDMVAVEWERNKQKQEGLSNTELIHMEDRFLSRYTPSDKDFVLKLMEDIKMADQAIS